MSLGKHSGFLLWGNRFYTHDFHESASPFGIYLIAFLTKEIGHLTSSFCRMYQMLLVHDPHDF